MKWSRCPADRDARRRTEKEPEAPKSTGRSVSRGWGAGATSAAPAATRTQPPSLRSIRRPGKPVRPPRSTTASTVRNSTSDTGTRRPRASGAAPGADGPGQRPETDRIEALAVLHPFQRRGPQLLEVALVLLCRAGEARQVLHHAWPRGGDQRREGLVADASPEQRRIGVGGIADRGEARGTHQRLGVGPPHAEQRADQRPPSGLDAGRPRSAAPRPRRISSVSAWSSAVCAVAIAE